MLEWKVLNQLPDGEPPSIHSMKEQTETTRPRRRKSRSVAKTTKLLMAALRLWELKQRRKV